ncbi:MAG TPA: anti-sigma factor [Kofleriaceae bacterium]|jgi:anti-sigma factor RsiW|nr:anti-sigma factor [Kofleriaceae bacterium]
MTTCETIQPRLTAYLDGELADDHGSVVRGHLRECAACRQVARDEAALRDGLRNLLPVDPPASLWAGVQAQLAAAEVADAHQPRWRRAFARWTPWTRWARWMPAMPQLAAGGLLAAAAVVALYVRAHRADEPAGQGVAVVAPHAMPAPHGAPAAPGAPTAAAGSPAAGDVTADLTAEPARTTASYDQAVGELMKLAQEVRPGWTDDRKAAFDAQIASLRAGVSHAGAPRAQQRAQRSLIRYLQGAIVRDDVLLASGGAR